jgi:hypothetical protein
MRTNLLVGVLVSLVVLSVASRADALPAFARRYGTSCQTCHIVYPKLTPFGEAFRRNGFKFPGVDAEFVKQEQVPLGQEAYRQVFPDAVWPGTLAAAPALAAGFNGQATIHPTKSSASAQADNGAVLSLQNLVEEGHLWAGGAFSEHISFFGELTFGADGTVDLEHSEVHFNDLGLSPHLVNLYVGRGVPTLTSFAPHSSYIGDGLMSGFAVTALYGGTTDSFSTAGQYNLVELNGMSHGRFIYSIGVNSGSNLDTRTTENATAHVGFKAGGMRLDGEGDTTGNATKPWAETALTVDVFGYRSASHYTNGGLAMDLDDLSWVLGGHVRATAGSFELDSGVYNEWHNHASDTGVGVKALAQYDELSYIVYPWLVPAVRLEYLRLAPDGGPNVSDLRVMFGAAFLIRPNLKTTLVALVEHANGAPPGSWDAAGGVEAPAVGTTTTDFEQIDVGLAYAF